MSFRIALAVRKLLAVRLGKRRVLGPEVLGVTRDWFDLVQTA